MGVVIVGSIALDVISTPSVKNRRVLGGSALYAALGLVRFAKARVVGVIGEDFPETAIRKLVSKGIDVKGIERKPGRTFCWEGRYCRNLSEVKTLATRLNVFADFSPRLPHEYRGEEAVFLGNIHPELQKDVLSQMIHPRIVAADTIACWIEGKRRILRDLLKKVHIFFVNESEAKCLSGQSKVIRAAQAISEFGPRLVVVKNGEHGTMAYDGRKKACFWVPAFPTCEIVDPTGAGDTFAGGFLGAMAREKNPFEPLSVKKALLAGSVMSSFAISALSIEGLLNATPQELKRRFQILLAMTPSPRRWTNRETLSFLGTL